MQGRRPLSEALIDVTDLRSGYGSLPVLHGMSFSIRQGEVAVFLGLNGAGKSTTVKALCGAIPVWSGQVVYEGVDITSWKTARSVAAGIVMVPEGRHVFSDLSVDRNLQVGAWTQRRAHEFIDERRRQIVNFLPRLEERRDQVAGTLSGGEQQMLAIGRALMANPKVLIIDEASLGLAPVIVKEIFATVSQFTQVGMTVILVEQNVGALEVADVGFFVQKGVIEAELRGDELADTERIRHLYLG